MADRLERYREKRDPGRTPEPFGAPGGEASGALAPRLFVVQKHAARRLHWDLRLELGGTLRSWAVPKGPSYDPADRRMAIEVEDHPVEYAGFEGIIPAGNYGAGQVIVWDRGWWRPRSDPEEGLARGKLVFELGGYKLRGEWTLVRTRRAGGGRQEWLLLKHRDPLAGPRELDQSSVLTGRLLEDVAAHDPRGDAAIAAAARLGARAWRGRRPVRPATPGEARAPFSRAGWLFEVDPGGDRVLAGRERGRALIRRPGGGDATRLFPEVAAALAMLPVDALLDGELAVLDPGGRPSPDALAARARLRASADVRRASVERPATLFALDLLALGALDVRPLALRERKRLLAGLVPRAGALSCLEHVEARGEELAREAGARGLAGILARRADAPYAARGAWRAIALTRRGAGGARPPSAARPAAPRPSAAGGGGGRPDLPAAPARLRDRLSSPGPRPPADPQPPRH